MSHYILTNNNFSSYVCNNSLIYSNSCYEIADDINLGNMTLMIPLGCTLSFTGGSFYNGTIKGSQTIISGSVNVTHLSGSVQKGFVVRQYNDKTKYMWNGLNWVVI